LELFAVSQPGLEEATYLEFQELGLKGTKSKGGVTFSGDHREIYLTNLWLRSANRVLLRLCSFRAKHFAELVFYTIIFGPVVSLMIYLQNLFNGHKNF